MRIALYQNAHDNQPCAYDLDWPGLVQILTTHVRTPCAHPAGGCAGAVQARQTNTSNACAYKNGAAWAPHEVEGTRAKANVRTVTAAVFDVDHASEAVAIDVFSRLFGVAWIAHSTHSHLPPSDYCFRVVFALSRPATAAEWPVLREVIRARFGLPADQGTRDASRLFYIPSAPEGAPVIATWGNGPPLDVDDLLRAATAPAFNPGPEWNPLRPPEPVEGDGRSPASIPALPAQPIDAYEVRRLLRAVRRDDSKELARRVLAGEPIGQPGERDTTLQRLAGLCAFSLPAETPADVLAEVIRPSLGATPWAPEDGPPWEVVFWEKYRRALATRVQRDEESRRFAEAVAARLSPYSGTGAQPNGASPHDGTAQPTEDPGAPVPENPDAWKAGAVVTIGKSGETRLENIEANYKLVLANAPEWRGVLRFNDVTKDVELVGGPLRADVTPDTLPMEVTCWIQTSVYGQLGLRPKPHQIAEVLLNVARMHTVDPLRDYLLSIAPEWDGVPRADDLFIRYFGAPTADHEGADLTGYLRAVGGKFLIGAVARALSPGCKVDTLPVVEGIQGLGKSKAFRVLATGRAESTGPFRDWFTDTKIDVQSRDSWMVASRTWLIELAELETLSRADVNALKAFFSRCDDLYRPPYGRTLLKVPRRCVFVGTTNKDDYLRDETGNRRYWPVRAGVVDLKALANDRDQLWAEAVARFFRDEPWWLEGRSEMEQAEQAESRTAPLPFAEAIVKWFRSRPPEARPREITLDDVAEKVLALEPGQLDERKHAAIGLAMRQLRFRVRRESRDGARTRVYQPPEALLVAPQQQPGAYRPPPLLTSITGGRPAPGAGA